MGNICCGNSDEINFISNLSELKSKFKEEYKIYLLFINKIKLDLNASIIENSRDLDNNNENHNNINLINNKRFYLIPRIWFENWEKRIEIIYKTNKFKAFECNFEFKNEQKLQKNYYEIISDDLWIELNRNQIYKLNNINKNSKIGLIINNLIIFQFSSNNSNSLEIFFFEKDEDLFFTNLLFSFEKCKDHQSECYNFLKLLKNSPIQEILGNIKYDKSEEFIVDNNKMIIYNKTAKIDEEVKNFREAQYMIVINPVHGPNSFENEENPDIYDSRKLDGYMERENNKKYYGEVIDLKQKGGDNTVNGFDISEINGKSNSNYLLNKNKTIKILKNNNNYSRNYNDNTKTFIFSLKNNSLISNIDSGIEDIKTRKRFMRSNEDKFSTKENQIPSNIFECYEESKNNQSFLESILYCLFNIKELTKYFINNKENNKDSNNSFSNEYLKIIEFLNKDNDLIDKLNQNKTNNIYEIIDNNESTKNVLKYCPNYNYQKILRLIIYQNSTNIISKIINTLHLELNKIKNNEFNLMPNDFSDEEKEQKDEIEIKNKKYEKFLKECRDNNSSIIFKLFYGIKETKVICGGCNKSHYKYEIMNTIEISMDKLVKFVKSKNINDNNQINIKDFLNYYSSTQNQNDNLVIECHFCNEYQNYSLINSILKYPEIVIICILYEDIHSNYIKFDLEEKIQLSNDEYKLIGIISSPENQNSGAVEEKYIAYCNTNQGWVFYDEEKRNNYDFFSNRENLRPITLFYRKMKTLIDN